MKSRIIPNSDETVYIRQDNGDLVPFPLRQFAEERHVTTDKVKQWFAQLVEHRYLTSTELKTKSNGKIQVFELDYKNLMEMIKNEKRGS